MTRLPGFCSPVGSLQVANDNVRPVHDGGALLATEQIACGIEVDHHMTIVRDPASGEWLIADFDGETVLLTLPARCTFDEAARAASVYAAAFRSGFAEGRALAQVREIA